jgi:hypothetical protein
MSKREVVARAASILFWTIFVLAGAGAITSVWSWSIAAFMSSSAAVIRIVLFRILRGATNDERERPAGDGCTVADRNSIE